MQLSPAQLVCECILCDIAGVGFFLRAVCWVCNVMKNVREMVLWFDIFAPPSQTHTHTHTHTQHSVYLASRDTADSIIASSSAPRVRFTSSSSVRWTCSYRIRIVCMWLLMEANLVRGLTESTPTSRTFSEIWNGKREESALAKV